MLEPDEGKLSRPVLRELEASNGLRLLGIAWLPQLVGWLVSEQPALHSYVDALAESGYQSMNTEQD